jgi:tetratricopeptide (TPR) repeat protein
LLLIAGIAFVASPRSAAPPSLDPAEARSDGAEADPLSAEPVQTVVAKLDQPLVEARPGLGASVAPRVEGASGAGEEQPAAPIAEMRDPKAATKPANVRRSSKMTSSASQEAAAPPREQPPDPALVEVELASMDAKALTERGDALHARGQKAIAAGYYRRALEIDPDYAPALVGIGWSLLRAKKYPEAMDNATRALELARGVDARPGLEAAAIYQIGRVHFERGERDAARGLLRQSTSLPGTPPQAWFYLGEALSSDNSPAAREAYQRYLELVPEGQLASRARRAIQ